MEKKFLYEDKEITAGDLAKKYIGKTAKKDLSEKDFEEWIDTQLRNGALVFQFDYDLSDWMAAKESEHRSTACSRVYSLMGIKGKAEARKKARETEEFKKPFEVEFKKIRRQYTNEWWAENCYKYAQKEWAKSTVQFLKEGCAVVKKQIKEIKEKAVESLNIPRWLDTHAEEITSVLQKDFTCWLTEDSDVDFWDEYADYYDEDDYYDDYLEDDYEEDDFDDYEDYDDYDDYEKYLGRVTRLRAETLDDFLDAIEDMEADPFFKLLDSDCENGYDYILQMLESDYPQIAELGLQKMLRARYYSQIDRAALLAFRALDRSSKFVLECLVQNPHYRNILKEKERLEEARKREEEARLRAEQEQKEKEERLKASLLSAIPDSYTQLYPLARNMSRKFILHIGPTNSGKTYAAMQAVREAGAGIYLAPLRLLAFEQYESLNADGYPCSLVTGEEREIIEGAQIQASTVEMMDPLTSYPVVVIDEAQMIADKDRGWAWTAAILGVCSPEIHVCAAPEAEGILISLIEECKDTYEIVRHTRQTSLVLDDTPFHFPKDVQKHDALIVFSKRNVHSVAYELRKKGIPCSIIYGNLPYDVRQAEARKFATGETDVLVATDAIGMGLNLPIKRIVFLETSKYDGVARRPLHVDEVKQIAGRAGRLGIFEEGRFTYDNSASPVAGLMNAATPRIKNARIGFPESLVGIQGSLSEILKRWKTITDKAGYLKMDVDTMIALSEELERRTRDKELIYKFVTIPFNPEGMEKQVWYDLVDAELHGTRFPLSAICSLQGAISGQAGLDDMERTYKVLDLLYSYNIRFNHPEDIQEILDNKKILSRRIIEHLDKQGLQPRKCKYCGKVLPWNYPYGMCNACHDNMYPQYWY